MSLAAQGVRGVDPTPSCSEFHSARIESMIASKSKFDTELEFRTAHSKVHWSELTRSSDKEGLNVESVGDHLRDFLELQKDAHWGSFCSDVKDVVLGKNLGEGAQADIYEAQVSFVDGEHVRRCVVKVMKGDCALADLQRQWPRGLVNLGVDGFRLTLYGALVKDPITQRHQFGFVMQRYWGDLRTLIDLRLEHKSNSSDPPFTVAQAKRFMDGIIMWMTILHAKGIILRDLKASNVLVSDSIKHDVVSSNEGDMFVYVADYECSVGVVGTAFWRAPEILQQLKNRVPNSKLDFTEKVDVYSYAMTCYEIVTGLIPFERLPNTVETRDGILNGARPELPHNLDPEIREIITSCWDPNPSMRPSFQDLWSQCFSEDFQESFPNLRMLPLMSEESK